MGGRNRVGGVPGDFEILNSLREHVAILDSAGCIVAVNEAWRRFAERNGGDPARCGIGVNYLEVCRQRDGMPLPEAATIVESLEAILQGKLAAYSCEYPCHSPQVERWFLMEATPLPSGGAVVCHRDITQRRSAEDGEREARALFGELFYGTTEPMFLCDADGRIHLVNGAFGNLFGLAPAKLVGRSARKLRNPGLRQILGARNEAIFATGETQIFDVTVEGKDGVRTVEVIKGGHRKGDGRVNLIWGSARDISDARATERKIVDTSDHERQHMGALLHEGPCQTLSGIWLHANALYDELVRADAPFAKDAREIALRAKDAGLELKKLLKDFLMIPVPLDDGEGFLMALEYLVEQNSEQNAKFRLSLPKTVRFDDPAVPRHLFRIAQEAVRNAVKHSMAQRLQIRLTDTRRALALTIEDDGIGFSPKPQTSSGIGLQVMHYRARAIGAVLEIRRLPKRGTAVVCTLNKPKTTE